MRCLFVRASIDEWESLSQGHMNIWRSNRLWKLSPSFVWELGTERAPAGKRKPPPERGGALQRVHAVVCAHTA